MVKHIAVNGVRHGGSPAEAMAFHWSLVAHDPARTVKVVHERLHDVISREPTEMILCAQLPFQLGQAWFAARNSVGCPQEILLNANDFANRPILNPLHRFLVASVMSAVQARKNG